MRLVRSGSTTGCQRVRTSPTASGAVADEQHVAAGSVSGCYANDHVADYARSSHGQIVGENDTIKVDVVSQIVDPFCLKIQQYCSQCTRR